MKKRWKLGVAAAITAAALSFAVPQGYARADEPDEKVEETTEIGEVRTTGQEPSQPTQEKASSGWVESKGKWYYYDKDGNPRTGRAAINGKWYLFNTKGVLLIGWHIYEGSWYFTNARGEIQTGWKLYDGKWYYFDEKGAMTTGWATVGGVRYYFGKSGAIEEGWAESDGKWYYLKKSGQPLTGWRTIGKRLYYFLSDGTMVTGKYRIDGVLHNFSSEGIWLNEVIERPAGSYNAAVAIDFAIKHTAVDIQKGLSGSQCIYGWQCAEFGSNCLKAGGGINVYDDHATALHNKLAKLPIIEEFVVPIEDGYVKLANVPAGHEVAAGDLILLYCPYETDGRPFVHTLLFVGWSPDGLAKVYCHNTRTAGTVSHRIYCYACHRKMSEAHVMHIKTNSAKENKTYPANTWMTIKGQKMHINGNGIKDTGFARVDGSWYYFNRNGVMETGWKRFDDGWYYFGSDGKMLTDWQKLEDGWYCFDNGCVKVGWMKEDGVWYYFDDNGHPMLNTTVKISGKEYTFDKTGACLNP